MKFLSLIACVAMIAAQTRAQTGSDSVLPKRNELLLQIDSWRQNELPVVTPPLPLTTKFELGFKGVKGLKAIEAEVSAAESAEALFQAKNDFEAWQHELLLAKYKNAPLGESMDAFARTQRQLIQQNQAAFRSLDLAVKIRGNMASVSSFGQHAGCQGLACMDGRFPNMHYSPATPPPATETAELSELISDHRIDYAGGKAIADEAAALVRHPAVEKCFGYVWKAIQVVQSIATFHFNEVDEAIPGGLQYFAKTLHDHPWLLDKLGYRLIDPNSIGDESMVPPGTILNYSPGCAGFNAIDGHIELTQPVPPGATWIPVTSDFSTSRSLSYIHKYQSCMHIYAKVRNN